MIDGGAGERLRRTPGGPSPLAGILWRGLAICAVAAGLVVAWRVFSAPALGPDTRIVVIFKSTDPAIAYWQIAKAGVETAAKEFNVQVSVVGPWEEKDIVGEIALVRRVIREHPQAIILAADDYNALVPVAKAVKRAGIRLLTIDSGLPPGVAASFIATDNVKAGEKEAALEARLLPPGSRVAILSFVKGTLPAIERERGVRDYLRGDPSIRIVGTWYSQDLRREAYAITTRLLAPGSRVDGIIALNEVATDGAAEAVARQKAGDRVALVGFDSDPIETTYLEAGVIRGIVLQKPFNMGYLAVKTAVELLKGERVPARIDTGSAVVTRENMNERENQKLLFPLLAGE